MTCRRGFRIEQTRNKRLISYLYSLCARCGDGEDVHVTLLARLHRTEERVGGQVLLRNDDRREDGHRGTKMGIGLHCCVANNAVR